MKSINLCKAPQVKTLKSLQVKLIIVIFNTKTEIIDFQNISKMTSMKVVPIPVIEDFANLIAYPSEQKVDNK